MRRAADSCAGKANLAEALAAVTQMREEAVGLRAEGSMRLREYDDNGKTSMDERTDMHLRFDPPDRLFARGQSLVGEALWLGMNEEEFWLRIKPQDVYFWGQREQGRLCPQELGLRPEHLVEALGVVDLNMAWSLVQEQGFDVLVGENKGVRKEVFIECCAYVITRIDYVLGRGETVSVRLRDYVYGEEGVRAASFIQIEKKTFDKTVALVDIDLKNIQRFVPTEKQLKGKLFRKPSTEGFERVYRLGEDCRFVRDE